MDHWSILGIYTAFLIALATQQIIFSGRMANALVYGLLIGVVAGVDNYHVSASGAEALRSFLLISPLSVAVLYFGIVFLERHDPLVQKRIASRKAGKTNRAD